MYFSLFFMTNKHTQTHRLTSPPPFPFPPFLSSFPDDMFVVHSLEVVEEAEEVVVVDRENKKIIIFDFDGVYLREVRGLCYFFIFFFLFLF